MKPNDSEGRATDKCSVTSDCVGTPYKHRPPLTAALLPFSGEYPVNSEHGAKNPK